MDASSDASDRAAIVVSGSLAARQWEAYLGAREIDSGARAWITPPLMTHAAWLESLWLAGPEPRPTPLSPSQSLALWRRVIRESASGAELIGDRGAAEWAADAWQLLCHWRIDPARERAGDSEPDYRAFLGWCREYRRVLADNGWVDHADIARLLPTAEWRAPARVTFADLAEPTPLQQALIERLGREGCRVDSLQPPVRTPDARRIRLPDAAEELRAAAAWACERIAASPSARVALVVADGVDRGPEIERAFADAAERSGSAGGVPVWHGGGRPSSNPRIGAALNALGLGSREATFESLSHWLRSPFFGRPEEAGARAALERQLRRSVRAQLPFAIAYRDTALARVLERSAPRSAAALERALAETAGIARDTPSRWARAWQRALTALTWDAAADARASSAWQSALEAFAALTPITGELEQADALAELERALERPSTEPLPVRGVHVVARLEDVGPGYDAAWLAGFTDANWPMPARCNPLLPRGLQRARGMPWATPQDARARSARRLEAVERRVGALVASWPQRVYDYETEPSPAIRGWRELAPTDVRATAPRLPVRARETVEDRAPPLAATQLRGGAGVLQRQARCPLRAFCQDRLGARELERVSAGLGARLRGTATHAALAELLAGKPTQGELAERRAGIPAIVDRVLGAAFADARGPLAALAAIEAERLSATLRRALDADLARAPFVVEDVELEKRIVVAGRELTVRVDRIDRLADGTSAVIDYKTGNRGSPKDWLRERPRDVQVPLYAAYATTAVRAAAIARAQPLSFGYTGYWDAGAFYVGAGRKLPDGLDWARLVSSWRGALEDLVLELAGGDTRIFVADVEDAEGAFAPLTRVREQLGILRGSVARW